MQYANAEIKAFQEKKSDKQNRNQHKPDRVEIHVILLFLMTSQGGASSRIFFQQIDISDHERAVDDTKEDE